MGKRLNYTHLARRHVPREAARRPKPVPWIRAKGGPVKLYTDAQKDAFVKMREAEETKKALVEALKTDG